jgi:hypothetical protein
MGYTILVTMLHPIMDPIMDPLIQASALDSWYRNGPINEVIMEHMIDPK